MADLLSDVRARLLQRRAVVSRLHATHREQERTHAGSAAVDGCEPEAASPAGRRLRRMTERESTELREIDCALARIDAHTYGCCEHCGGAIGRQRLTAIPEARACIGCSASSRP